MNTNSPLKKELSPLRLLAIKLTVILLIPLGFSLGIAELVLCIIWSNKTNRLNRSELVNTDEFLPTRYHRLIPNVKSRHKEIEYDYIRANNSLGMRDKDYSLPKGPNTFRMLFLGDSMVQIYGVTLEKSMAYLLENSINQPKRSQKNEERNQLAAKIMDQEL